jgi:hypothetical protein
LTKLPFRRRIMGLIDRERNSADERVSVIARLRALGVDLSKELLHAAQVAESAACATSC